MHFGDPPDELIKMILSLKYKAGWSFTVDGGYIKVTVLCEDSLGRYVFDTAMAPSAPFMVIHTIEIPPAMIFNGDLAYMRHWLIETIIGIETHEACEFFKLPDGNGDYYTPFFPHSDVHGPYKVVDKTKEKAHG